MVLVDSTAPRSTANPRANPRATSTGDGDRYDLMGRVSALISTSARFGLGRLYGQFDYGSLPPASRDEARASVATAKQLGSTIDEYIEGNASMEEAASLSDFGDKPLVVLTAGVGSAAGWSAKQNAMAALSTNSAHRVLEGASHGSMVTDEEDAVATSQAILDVVTSLRSGVQLVR
jgi:hypothetical protein